jgi:hypothetical protein
MDIVPNNTTKEIIAADSLVQIELWDAFIVSHSKCHAKFLLENSYDQRPFERENMAVARTCFRFTVEVWERLIKSFLIQNRIPVTMQVINLQAATV